MNRIGLGLLFAALAAAQTPVLRQGVSVRMPVAAHAVLMPNADSADSLIVAVTARGAVYLEITPVTPAQLSDQVKTEIARHPGKKVYFKADQNTPYATVSQTLSALRKSGISDLSLLTAQPQQPTTSYVTPTGLEVLIPPPAPDATHSVTLRIGTTQLSDADLKQRVQGAASVVLQADETTPFADVVRAVDVCRAAASRVYLDASRR